MFVQSCFIVEKKSKFILIMIGLIAYLTIYNITSVGISMGPNCAPLLADLFLYSYEAVFRQSFLPEQKKFFAVTFYLTFDMLRHALRA